MECIHFENIGVEKPFIGGKQSLVLNFIKNRACLLSQLVLKMGTLDLGAEIASTCGIPHGDAITRGSQIRQEGIFASVSAAFRMVLISPDEKQRAECKACEQLPLNMEPESGLHQRGVAVLERGLLSIIQKRQIC